MNPSAGVARLVLALLAALASVALGQGIAATARADVLVLGSEPEAIAVAVAAAETGARTVLLSEDRRLGGLFVLGALNVLDVRTSPVDYQRGLFGRWWDEVGGGAAFDPHRAERVFGRLLHEAGVEVQLGLVDLRITVEGDRVTGAAHAEGEVRARQVVDGHADMAFAHEAGAPATFGWRGFGMDMRMADTLVFRIEGVDWDELRAASREHGRAWAVVDDRVAWGPFGGVPASYAASDPDLRLRGLNLGRADDGAVWANALLIHGVDPFDPVSKEAARRRAAAEAERIVPWLAERLPGFASARPAGVAEALYVRETRHLDAHCVLDADHVLDNVTGPFDVAVGGYPLDLQSLTPQDSGYVFGTPVMYGVPLCVTVPRDGPSGLWVVGRSAGYDPVAHSSARVVPLGMAVAEGVGVAAARSAREDRAPDEVVGDALFLAGVRAELTRRGAYLPTPREREPVGPVAHPQFGAYRSMLGRGLALGGYGNDPGLDEPVPALSHVYLLANVAQRFFFEHDQARALVAEMGDPGGQLTAELAAPVQRALACRLVSACPDEVSPEALARLGLWPEGVPITGPIDRGEMYALGEALVRFASAHPGRP